MSNRVLKPTKRVAVVVPFKPNDGKKYNGTLTHHKDDEWLYHTKTGWGYMSFKSDAAAETWCKKAEVRFVPKGYIHK